MQQSKPYNLIKQLDFKITFLVCMCLLTTACSTATYRIVDSNGKVVQSVEDDAPGGDTAALVVLYGPNVAPAIDSKVNNEEFVRATGRLGRAALNTALKALKAATVP